MAVKPKQGRSKIVTLGAPALLAGSALYIYMTYFQAATTPSIKTAVKPLTSSAVTQSMPSMQGLQGLDASPQSPAGAGQGIERSDTVSYQSTPTQIVELIDPLAEQNRELREHERAIKRLEAEKRVKQLEAEVQAIGSSGPVTGSVSSMDPQALPAIGTPAKPAEPQYPSVLMVYMGVRHYAIVQLPGSTAQRMWMEGVTYWPYSLREVMPYGIRLGLEEADGKPDLFLPVQGVQGSAGGGTTP